MNPSSELGRLFRRDLTRLVQQLEAFPDDASVWRVLPGVTNCAGNLALHLEGNLREFVCRQLGNVPYRRARDLEFSSKGIARPEMVARIRDLIPTVGTVVDGLTGEQLRGEYPQEILEIPLSTQATLFQLYGHLNWHLGQIDTLRRALSGNGAIAPAGLLDV